MGELLDIFPQFRNKHILILSEVFINKFITGTEIGVNSNIKPKYQISEQSQTNGLISIILKFIQNFGGNVELVTCIGNDFEAKKFLEEMNDLNIGTQGIIQSEIQTPKLLTLQNTDEEILSLVYKYNLTSNQRIVINEKVLQFVKKQIDRSEIVLVVDLNAGFLEDILIYEVLGLAKEKGKRVIAFAKEERWAQYREVYMLYVNNDLLNWFKNDTFSKIQNNLLSEIGNAIIDQTHVENIFITNKEHRVLIKKTPQMIKELHNCFNPEHHSKDKILGAVISILTMLCATDGKFDQIFEITNFAIDLAMETGIYVYYSLKDLEKQIKQK